MGSDRFDIRPFCNAGALERSLSGSSMVLGSSTAEPGRRAVVSTTQFQTSQVRLRLAPSARALRRMADAVMNAASEAGIDPDDLELVLISSSPRLKLADIVWRCPLPELSAASHDLQVGAGATRPSVLEATHGGAVFDLYLALSVERPPTPLKPWRKGTWLARARFSFSTGLDSINFTPIRLTEELRIQLGLPGGTVRFVDIDDPLLSGADSSAIRVYVDAALLAEVARAPSTSVARSFQRELFLTAVAAVVTEGSRIIALRGGVPTIDEIEGSLVDRLLQRAVGPDHNEPERRRRKEYYLSMLATDPERLRAYVEAWIPDLLKDWRLSHSEAGL